MADTSNSADTLDVRDLITRFEDLEQERADLAGAVEEAQTRLNRVRTPTALDKAETALASANKALKEWDDSDEAEELNHLSAFLEELKDGGGDHQWRGRWYPVTLVRDSYFRDFAQDEAEQLGLVTDDSRWPYTSIDWEKAADELRVDYDRAEFDGVTYWYR